MVPLPPLNFTSSSSASGRSQSGDIWASTSSPFSTGDFITGSTMAGNLKAGALPLTALAVLAIVWLMHKRR